MSWPSCRKPTCTPTSARSHGTGSSARATPSSSGEWGRDSSAPRSAPSSGGARPPTPVPPTPVPTIPVPRGRSGPGRHDPPYRPRRLRDLPVGRTGMLRLPRRGGERRPAGQGLDRHRLGYAVEPAALHQPARAGCDLALAPARRPHQRPAGGVLRAALWRLRPASGARAGLRTGWLGRADGRVHLGPLDLTAVATFHSVETYGVRASAPGATLAYSADSGPCDALYDLADG